MYLNFCPLKACETYYETTYETKYDKKCHTTYKVRTEKALN